MLLFVIAALTIFHFALPHGTGDVAALGLLWCALVFTALLGLTRAFVAEREQSLFDALVLAPCDRSAIWLAKSLAVLAFLVAPSSSRCRRSRAFFSGLDGRTVAAVALADIGIVRRRDALRRDGGRRARPRAPAAAALPAAWRSRSWSAASAATSGSSCSTTRSSPLLAWAIVRVRRRRGLSRRTTIARVRRPLPHGARWPRVRSRSCCWPSSIALIFFYAPDGRRPGLLAADLLLPRADRADRRTSASAGAPGRRCAYLWKRDERADLESYVAIHQGVIFGALTLFTGSIWARASWGVWWSWSENQLVLFLVLFLFYCAYFMLRFSRRRRARRARTCAPSTRSSASC